MDKGASHAENLYQELEAWKVAGIPSQSALETKKQECDKCLEDLEDEHDEAKTLIMKKRRKECQMEESGKTKKDKKDKGKDKGGKDKDDKGSKDKSKGRKDKKRDRS